MNVMNSRTFKEVWPPCLWAPNSNCRPISLFFAVLQLVADWWRDGWNWSSKRRDYELCASATKNFAFLYTLTEWAVLQSSNKNFSVF